MNSGGSSFAYSQKQTGTSTGSYSTSYPYSGNARNESDSSRGGSNGTASYGGTLSEGYSQKQNGGETYSYNSSRSASSPDSYDWNKGYKNSWESDFQGTGYMARNEGEASRRGDNSASQTGNVRRDDHSRESYAYGSSSKGESFGSSYEGSFEKDGGTPPYSYGLDRGGASELAARDYGQDSEADASYGYSSSSDSSQKRRRNSQSYTASINTGSAGSNREDESPDDQEDSGASRYGTDLSRTIPPQKSESSRSANSYSGYSPIPIYDEGESEKKSMAAKDSHTSSSVSDSGYKDGSASTESSGRGSGRSGYQYSDEDSNDSDSETIGSGSSERDGKSTQQNRKPQNQVTSRRSDSEKDESKTQSSGYSFQANSSANSVSGSSTKSESSSQRSTKSGTRNSSSDESQSRTITPSDNQADSDSGNGTGGTTKQESAAKPTPGWETMIGIVGLLILFIQSMRWLSLLYDRSYYQRRRSYRPVRRRTAWSSTPPPAYRWYY